MTHSVFGKDKVVNPAFDIPLRKARGVEEIRVTPEIAQHWLTFNTSNRALTNAKVEQFKRDMESGYWNDDGATIRFTYGKLLDGQHRLTALVLAGVTLRMLVVHGLDSESQVTMDTGRGRTPRDVLSIEGLDKWASSTLGSAIHTIMAYETGRAVHSSMKFTNREVRNYYLEHQSRLDKSVRAAQAYPRRMPIIPLARAMALHYIFSKKDSAQADTFFERLMNGVDLAKDSPIYQARKLLEGDVRGGRYRASYAQFCLVVKAWNSFRRGSSLKTSTSLYPRADEAFPEIQ